MGHHVQIQLDSGEYAALKLLSVARNTPMATIVKGALREHLTRRKDSGATPGRSVALTNEESARAEVERVQSEVSRYLQLAAEKQAEIIAPPRKA